MNQLDRYIKLGLQQGLFLLEGSRSWKHSKIKYIGQDPYFNLTPEEKVRAGTFFRLVVDYKYPPQQIKMEVPVTMGSDKSKRADIVVYKDKDCLVPHILVECKNQDVSEAEFQQAINQAYSYAYAMPNDIKYIWVTSGIRNAYYEVDKSQNSRNYESDIPAFGVDELGEYKYVYGAEELEVESGKQSLSDLVVKDQSDLTRIFKKAHEALWSGGQLNPSEAFDELYKVIFCKIWDERKNRKPGEPYDFQVFKVSKKVEKEEKKRKMMENDNLYSRVKALYEEGRKQDEEVFRDNIRLTPEKVRTVVEYLQDVNLGDTDMDSKGRAFETFMGSFFRGNFGQYFTPREIVEFIVDVLPIKNNSRVLDTSCGSGGFLLYALDKVRKQASDYYPNHDNDTKQYAKWFSYWHDFAKKNLYGIEISEQISRAAKMNMIIHDDGHTNVVTSDGLVSDEELTTKTGNQGFKYGTFNFIITNPPFGSSVRLSEQAYLKTYQLGKKEEDWLAVKSQPETDRERQNTEVLFIEQNYKYLDEGGYLAIVIPDGILTNSSMQYVRDQIEDWFRIVAVISLPQTAFSANGAGVKSSVLFLKKWSKKERENITHTKWNNRRILLKDSEYIKKRQTWDNEIKQIQKDKAEEIKNTQNISITTAKQTVEYIVWNVRLLSDYTEKINQLKERLEEEYQQSKREDLPDYPIFMAIAEEIGYDATGKKTANNELKMIGKELKAFIESIETKTL